MEGNPHSIEVITYNASPGKRKKIVEFKKRLRRKGRSMIIALE